MCCCLLNIEQIKTRFLLKKRSVYLRNFLHIKERQRYEKKKFPNTYTWLMTPDVTRKPHLRRLRSHIAQIICTIRMKKHQIKPYISSHAKCNILKNIYINRLESQNFHNHWCVMDFVIGSLIQLYIDNSFLKIMK
jgi:hypothetical protein